MGHEADGAPECVTGSVELSIAGRPLRIELSAPTARVPPRRLLPLFQRVADALVDVACESAAAEGQTISCKQGCGACCRQLVPISVSEAAQIRARIEALPQPQVGELRARFAAARARLEQAGLLETLLHPEQVAEDDSQALGMRYFELHIACPFLEDESCSIHRERPIACREYLVTSAAEHCASPSVETIRGVKLPAKASRALRQIERADPSQHARWVPLILADAWDGAALEQPALRAGVDIVRDFFTQLTKRALPESAR